MEITTLGAFVGLAVAIILIIKKFEPAYSMILGALVGGLVGGAGLQNTVSCMITGAQDIMTAVIRIVASGVLAGILIQSGAAAKIADKIINLLGEKRALFALALSTMILTGVGVFGDVAVITVAPIALSIGNKIGYSKFVLLAAMVGGEKAGMVISPNPNTIAAAENFGVGLSSLMAAGLIPGIAGLIVTVIITIILSKKYKAEMTTMVSEDTKVDMPSLFGAIAGPIVVIVLLMLRPIVGITVDPLIALPLGGIVGILCMKQTKHTREYLSFGLSKMMPVAILLMGTGTISGIIKTSQLQYDMTAMLELINLPEFLLAPISGALMGAATASSSAGATIASSTFAASISTVVTPLAGAAMLHAGTIVLDTLPHGSFFHASAGAVEMTVSERMKLLPIDMIIGLTITITSTILYGVIL